MDPVLETTPAKLAAAFTEWRRRATENPEQFASDADVATMSQQELGEREAAYFFQLLAELAAE